MDFMLDICTPWNPADLSEQKRYGWEMHALQFKCRAKLNWRYVSHQLLYNFL